MVRAGKVLQARGMCGEEHGHGTDVTGRPPCACREPLPSHPVRSAVTHSHDDAVLLHGASISARARPVPHRPTTAQLVLLGQHSLPTTGDLVRWLASLVDHGYQRVRTGALTPAGAHRFATIGFSVVQELVLLELGRPSFRHPPRRASRPLRDTDLADAAALDTAAFGLGWGMDAAGLADVCLATPSYRGRIVEQAGSPIAVAISGRDAELGFIQRLAVHPDHQRRGHGDALVADALRWMGRGRVRRVLVNTHVDNTAARRLYARHGFVELPDRLMVSERDL